MSLGFEPSVGQILPNQTGKTKDSKQEEEFPDPSPQSWEQPAVSNLTVCCDVNVSPHGTTGNQTYSEGLRLDYVMKTRGSSWSDGCLFVSGVELIFQERGKLKIRNIWNNIHLFLCKTYSCISGLHRPVHLRSPEITAAGTALTTTYSVCQPITEGASLMLEDFIQF